MPSEEQEVDRRRCFRRFRSPDPGTDTLKRASGHLAVMMLPTHALGGMLLAIPLSALAPEAAAGVVLAGGVGGALPDLDMYAGHRRALHYPIYYSLAAMLAIGAALLASGALVAAVAALLAGAAAHSVSDAFGGGLELRPWEGTADRAVYNHYGKRWIAPRRWVRYDGAPEDLLLAGVLAAPLALIAEGSLAWLVGGLLAVAGIYAAVRRRLPAVADALVARLPERTRRHLPARYTVGSGE